MPTGAITEYVNVAQVALYLFWIFFFALIIYLHRENKREGYPLDTDEGRRVTVHGFPKTPPDKYFKLADGSTAIAPAPRDKRPVAARPTSSAPGAPLEPTGNPMVDGVGPAAWAERKDIPDVTFEGLPRIVPMRVDAGFGLASRDPDPRGLQVVGLDNQVAGVVRDVWIDRSEPIIRYLEVDVPTPAGTRNVLIPNMLVVLRRSTRGAAASEDKPLSERLIGGRPFEVRLDSVCAHHLADAPVRKHPDQVTRLEEDQAMAYFGSGHFYSLDRREPLA
jgi:photosynthetic reaction center H subunit